MLLRPLDLHAVPNEVLGLALVNALACTVLPVWLVMTAIERIGSALTLRGLEAARHFDAAAVLVLGHPEYYPKFGFSNAATAKVSAPWSGSPAFMGIALVDGALDEPLMVAYPDAFSAGQG